jgi:hypothetical protein
MAGYRQRTVRLGPATPSSRPCTPLRIRTSAPSQNSPASLQRIDPPCKTIVLCLSMTPQVGSAAQLRVSKVQELADGWPSKAGRTGRLATSSTSFARAAVIAKGIARSVLRGLAALAKRIGPVHEATVGIAARLPALRVHTEWPTLKGSRSVEFAPDFQTPKGSAEAGNKTAPAHAEPEPSPCSAAVGLRGYTKDVKSRPRGFKRSYIKKSPVPGSWGPRSSTMRACERHMADDACHRHRFVPE